MRSAAIETTRREFIAPIPVDKNITILRMDIKQSHHKNAYFSYKGVQYLKTRVSHGEGDIPSIVARRIRKQLYLNRDQFKNLIKCPLGYDDFVLILNEKEILPS